MFLVTEEENFLINAMPNKSMDVSSGQLLSYHVVFLPLACVVAAPNHVISTVRRFLAKSTASIREHTNPLNRRTRNGLAGEINCPKLCIFVSTRTMPKQLQKAHRGRQRRCDAASAAFVRQELLKSYFSFVTAAQSVCRHSFLNYVAHSFGFPLVKTQPTNQWGRSRPFLRNAFQILGRRQP